MNRPVITLLTDFGTTDHYVAAMKGVMLGICPQAQLVDVSHGIRAYAVEEAAFLLAQSWRCFPPGTVHLVVVDPGVGSSRRPLVAEAGGHFFVAPDNGVLSLVGDFAARELAEERFFRHPVSRTFHGRDLFAPAAAHLAAGVPTEEFGPKIDDPLILPFGEPVETTPGCWTGTVLHVDRFGNIVTSFDWARFRAVAEMPFALEAGLCRATRYCPHYSASESGEIFAIRGSSGYIEVSVNQGDAASLAKVSAGDPVKLIFCARECYHVLV